MRHRAAPLVAIVTAAVSMSACGGSVTAPSTSHPPDEPFLLITCVPGAPLACTARSCDGDVTAGASWSAADSFRLALGSDIASDAVVFRSPGIPTVLSPRNVYIRAEYTNRSGCGHALNLAPHAYALTTNGGAVPLAYIAGAVYDGSGTTSGNELSDATVEIIDGESAGKRATTGPNGSFMIEFLRMEQPFTIRASKAGYSTDTQTSPGIVDVAGYPSATSFTFHLQK